MKLVTLVENSRCREDLICEHGLSLYLETGEHKILFDMGQSGAFWDNAETLGVDLKAVDFGMLSHGHYDHGGGMGVFLERNHYADIYVNQYAFESHFNASGKDIGLNPAILGGRIRFVKERLELAPGISVETVPFGPADTAGMTTLGGRPEDFRHEQYLLVEEQGKRILISGCSHKGIVAIAEHFRPDILVGGFHFMKTEDERVLREAAEKLMALDCLYYTGHCTGDRQFAFLKEIMGDRLQSIRTGSLMEVFPAPVR